MWQSYNRARINLLIILEANSRSKLAVEGKRYEDLIAIKRMQSKGQNLKLTSIIAIT